MSTEAVIQPPLNGVGGWLIWPVANFALVIFALIFFIFRHTENLMAIAVASLAIVYLAATLFLTMKHAKAARYMFMAFYVLTFAIGIFEIVSTLRLTSIIPITNHDLLRRLVVEMGRSAIEVGTFLYLVFSRRVRQTFTN